MNLDLFSCCYLFWKNNEFVVNHKTIKEIAKKFNRSINPIKSFLRNNLENYFDLVRKNNSWRKTNIPELNQKMKIAASKGGLGFSKFNNTWIEIAMKKILDELNVDYQFQYYLHSDNDRFNFDFFVKNKNLLIECDGDYWHGNPKIYQSFDATQIKTKNRDILKEAAAKNQGLKLIRFWELEFKNNLKSIEEKLKIICK